MRCKDCKQFYFEKIPGEEPKRCCHLEYKPRLLFDGLYGCKHRETTVCEEVGDSAFQIMSDEGLGNLQRAVIIQAVKDYKSAIKRKSAHKIDELERFFRSEYLTLFTDLDGEYLIMSVRRLSRKVMQAKRYPSRQKNRY